MTYFMNFAIWKNINTNFYLQILLHENAAYTVVLVTLAVLHTGVCTVPIDSCGVVCNMHTISKDINEKISTGAAEHGWLGVLLGGEATEVHSI